MDFTLEKKWISFISFSCCVTEFCVLQKIADCKKSRFCELFLMPTRYRLISGSASTCRFIRKYLIPGRLEATRKSKEGNWYPDFFETGCLQHANMEGVRDVFDWMKRKMIPLHFDWAE
jgi:hypothetical protein